MIRIGFAERGGESRPIIIPVDSCQSDIRSVPRHAFVCRAADKDIGADYKNRGFGTVSGIRRVHPLAVRRVRHSRGVTPL